MFRRVDSGAEIEPIGPFMWTKLREAPTRDASKYLVANPNAAKLCQKNETTKAEVLSTQWPLKRMARDLTMVVSCTSGGSNFDPSNRLNIGT